ncbi:MAG: hypothetical protein OXC17_11200 [Aestuariivita sp.]|nr:hypothetical protein [Aestuariivita sp.]
MKPIWCLPPEANADFVYAIEDVLSVYQRDFAADTVLVCMDETLRQQTKETRTPCVQASRHYITLNTSGTVLPIG